MGVGAAYRQDLDAWIRSGSARLGCVEIRAADFYRSGAGRLRQLADAYPSRLLVQGGRLSLATPGPLSPVELACLAAVVEIAQPLWISEPVGFRRTAEVELAAVCPVRADPGMVVRIADHAREAAETCSRPLVLENIPAYVRIPAPLSETEFINRLCERAECGLLLDLTALFVNACNHDFDPGRWLDEVEPGRVVGLRVGSCASRQGRWFAGCGDLVHDGVWRLARESLERFRPQAIVLTHEWDVPHPSEIASGLDRLASLVAERRRPPAPPTGTA